jgi:hypothetical protein
LYWYPVSSRAAMVLFGLAARYLPTSLECMPSTEKMATCLIPWRDLWGP